jgi:hypothetical protein
MECSQNPGIFLCVKLLKVVSLAQSDSEEFVLFNKKRI